MSRGRIVVAGGSGFIGREILRQAKEAGWTTVALSRRNQSIPFADEVVVWSGRPGDPVATDRLREALEGAEGVINLSGRPVMGRWTPTVMQEILNSRVESTRAIGEAILACQNPPKSWVNASAVGWYGDTRDREVSEGAPAADDFLGRVCQAWEAAQTGFDLPGTVLSRVRVGFVLGQGGGAYPMLSKVTKLFAGSALGSGRQHVAWIHVEDVAAMFLWALENRISGPLNGCAPAPATNSELMAAFRRAFGRPFVPPAPEFAVRAMMKVIGLEADLVLGSQRVVPFMPVSLGFRFRWTDLDQTLASLDTESPQAWTTDSA
ncbi:MAG: TIGR01777 family oxidoreductase [Fimbriimonadaceae bacterium]|nr:TIGR01777 family oxidoreductase [Fimbriimonadaceae bacterium]